MAPRVILFNMRRNNWARVEYLVIDMLAPNIIANENGQNVIGEIRPDIMVVANPENNENNNDQGNHFPAINDITGSFTIKKTMCSNTLTPEDDLSNPDLIRSMITGESMILIEKEKIKKMIPPNPENDNEATDWLVSVYLAVISSLTIWGVKVMHEEYKKLTEKEKVSFCEDNNMIYHKDKSLKDIAGEIISLSIRNIVISQLTEYSKKITLKIKGIKGKDTKRITFYGEYRNIVEMNSEELRDKLKEYIQPLMPNKITFLLSEPHRKQKRKIIDGIYENIKGGGTILR